MEENIEETLSFYRLPREHHKHLKSTNMLERINQELKRRTHVIRIFPNEESCLRLIRALAGTTRAANDVAGHCAVSGTLPLPYAGGKMSEPGNGSDRYAMPRRFAKSGRSRRNLVPALLADPIRASENHISTGLSNTLMSLNRHENWFNARDAGQFTIVNSPYGVTLILCLSEPRENAAWDTELIASFRIDDKKTTRDPNQHSLKRSE